MENATKAILIAGGILISIVVISVFYFAFRQMSNSVESTQPNTAQKELQDFNKGFEAYNKKLMYGADIISVLNKAIDNNKKYNVEFYNEPGDPENLDYYVDVIFTYNDVKYSLKEDFTRYTARNRNKIQENFLDVVGLKDDPNTEGIDESKGIFAFKIFGFKCTRNKIQWNKRRNKQTSSR